MHTGTSSKSKISTDQISKEVCDGQGEGLASEKFQVRKARQVGEANPRNYFRIDGEVGPSWDIPNNDIESVSHAVLERVFFVKSPKGGFQRAPKPWDHPSVIDEPNPRKAAEEKMRSRFRKFVAKMQSAANNHGKVSPMTDQEFLDSYGGAKRRCYEAAVESFRDRPLEERDCEVKVFTKDEYRKPGGAPRAIQPRSPRYNVKLGRHIKHLEHKIFDAIDEIFDPSRSHRTVAKGMNMNTRGETIAKMWSEFNDPIAVGLDASRFDQHINKILLDNEQRIYQMWAVGHGADLPSLKSLLRAQLVNKGCYRGKDGKLKYQVQGCRMSGDMNTSLGNVVVMCMLMYAYFSHKGLLGKVRLLNDGDDCVIIMDRKYLKPFIHGLTDWFLEMGLTMEFDGIYHSLESIEFCQSRPVLINGKYRLVPRPTKRLYSDVITTKRIDVKKVYLKQVGAIAGCGLAASSGLPVFQSFYSWLGRGATPWIPEQGNHYFKYRQELVKGMDVKTREINWEDRISFYFAYDITPSEQILLEQYYESKPDPIWCEPTSDPIRHLDTAQYLAFPQQQERKDEF